MSSHPGHLAVTMQRLARLRPECLTVSFPVYPGDEILGALCEGCASEDSHVHAYSGVSHSVFQMTAQFEADRVLSRSLSDNLRARFPFQSSPFCRGSYSL